MGNIRTWTASVTSGKIWTTKMEAIKAKPHKEHHLLSGRRGLETEKTEEEGQGN